MNADEFGPQRLVIAAFLTKEDRERIGEWSGSLQWPKDAVIKDPSTYHITVLYSQIGGDDLSVQGWINDLTPYRFDLVSTSLDIFTNPGHHPNSPIVLRFMAPEMAEFVEDLMEEAEGKGLHVSRFDDTYNPHVTLGFASSLPKGDQLLISLRTTSIGVWS